MEVLRPQKIRFTGKGSKLFTIYFINIFLTIVTLGIYYPWAKAIVFRYLWNETTLGDVRFEFHGLGKEMFIGFIKAIGIISPFFLIYILLMNSREPILMGVGGVVLFFGIAIFSPLAIHGAAKYRSSRTSWNGIHFGYRGSRSELMILFLKGLVLTLLTLGIYSFWLQNSVRKYVIDHIRFGSVTFCFKGRGTDFFFLNLKGLLLTIITLGVYIFWYARDYYSFLVDNTEIQQGSNTIAIKSSATSGAVFNLVLVNAIILVFTLGLGFPFAIARTYKFYFEHINLQDYLNTGAIIQTEEDYKDATGENMMEILDIGF